MLFGAFLRARPVSPWDNREPIREELFSVERLEQHARSLAVAQKVTSKSSNGLPLAGQLAGNARQLLAAYRSITEEVAKGRAITPAAEWLIDNYHLVEKQIYEISNRFAAWLLPAASETRRRPPLGLSESVWPGLGLRRS